MGVENVADDVHFSTVHYFMVPLYLLLATTGLVFNIGMLTLMTRDKRLREQTGIVLLFVLTFDDMCVGITGVCTHIANLVYDGFPPGSIACTISSVFIVISCAESVQLLALIAIERYAIVVLRKPIPAARLNGYIVFTWLFAAMLATAPVMGWGEFVLMQNESYCVIKWWDHTPAGLLFTSFCLLCLGVPLVSCAVLYYRIFAFVKANKYVYHPKHLTGSAALNGSKGGGGGTPATPDADATAGTPQFGPTALRKHSAGTVGTAATALASPVTGAMTAGTGTTAGTPQLGAAAAGVVTVAVTQAAADASPSPVATPLAHPHPRLALLNTASTPNSTPPQAVPLSLPGTPNAAALDTAKAIGLAPTPNSAAAPTVTAAIGTGANAENVTPQHHKQLSRTNSLNLQAMAAAGGGGGFRTSTAVIAIGGSGGVPHRQSIAAFNAAAASATAASASTTAANEHRSDEREREIAKRMLALCAAFGIFWFPYFVHMLGQFIYGKQFPAWFDFLALTGSYANSVANPLLYVYINPRIRSIFDETVDSGWCKWCCCRCSRPTSHAGEPSGSHQNVELTRAGGSVGVSHGSDKAQPLPGGAVSVAGGERRPPMSVAPPILTVSTPTHNGLMTGTATSVAGTPLVVVTTPGGGNGSGTGRDSPKLNPMNRRDQSPHFGSQSVHTEPPTRQSGGAGSRGFSARITTAQPAPSPIVGGAAASVHVVNSGRLSVSGPAVQPAPSISPHTNSPLHALAGRLPPRIDEAASLALPPPVVAPASGAATTATVSGSPMDGVTSPPITVGGLVSPSVSTLTSPSPSAPPSGSTEPVDR